MLWIIKTGLQVFTSRFELISKDFYYLKLIVFRKTNNFLTLSFLFFLTYLLPSFSNDWFYVFSTEIQISLFGYFDFVDL